VLVDEENKTMEVVVPDEKLSLAIGKKGQNVKLASKLTGWKIDVISESKMQERNEAARRSLREIPGIGDMTVEILFLEGYRSAEEVARATEEELAQIEGIGPEKAKTLLQAARSLMEQKSKAKAKEDAANLETLDGVGQRTAELLVEHGIKSVEQLKGTPVETLVEIPGIGEKKAEQLLRAAERALEARDRVQEEDRASRTGSDLPEG
jgi:N utilization substance protein A